MHQNRGVSPSQTEHKREAPANPDACSFSSLDLFSGHGSCSSRCMNGQLNHTFSFLLYFAKPVLPAVCARSVGGILHLRLEVVAPPEVSSFPFKASDVRRVMDLQVNDLLSSCVHRIVLEAIYGSVAVESVACILSSSMFINQHPYTRQPTPHTHHGK